MRTFETIRTDIKNTDDQIKKLEQEKKDTKYTAENNATGKGVRTIIWSLLAMAGTVMVLDFLFGNNRSSSFPGIPIAGALVLLPFISSVRYLKSSITTVAARVFAIIGGILFLLGMGVFGLLIYVLIYAVFAEPIEQSEIIVFWEAFACLLVYLIPISFLFFGSIVKRKKELKKIKDCEQKKVDLDEQISARKKDLGAFERELYYAQSSVETQFYAETKKDIPDERLIKNLELLGYEPAKRWRQEKEENERKRLEKKRKEENSLKGKEIYDKEMLKDSPNLERIEKAADLGYPPACLYAARELSFDCIDNYVYYTGEEIYSLFKSVKKYIDIAASIAKSEQEIRLIKVLGPLAQLNICIYSRGKEDFPKDLDKLPERLRKWSKDPNISAREKTFVTQTLEAVVAAINEKKKFEENAKYGYSSSNYSYQEESYNSNWASTSYSNTGTTSFSDEELRDYHIKNCHGLWNERVIDNDPNLTYSQKEQLKAYNRIHGD